MKRYSHSYILLIALFGFGSCAQDVDSPHPEQGPELMYPISWSTPMVQGINTRALVNNSLLEESCTPSGGRSIGVWGQSVVSSGEQSSIYQDFVATPLTFAPKAEDSNPHNNWNYPGEAVFWRSNAIYDFRACYPQDVMTGLMTQMDATVFQGGPINTSALQEDILVAATHINTRTADLSKPVPLDLRHIFAALKFKVKAVDGFTPSNGEGVTSCWLQNQDASTDLFSPSGYLVHSGNETPKITWYPYESSTAPMYVWKHEGVSFANEGTLYTPNGGLEGDIYTNNDGWILVVPQPVKAETLHFCYTLKNAGSQVFSVAIPAITYECSMQYTYVLEIRGSKVDLKLTISPWNHLESSYDIIL